MPALTLRPMTEAEYAVWRAHSVEGYAQMQVAAGAWSADDAPQRAERSFDELLPEGLRTQDMLLLSGVDAEGRPVGVIWLSLRHPSGRPGTGYVYDIEVLPARRGEGLGRALLAAGEQVLRERGLRAIGLNVHGGNETAISLYASSGYLVTTMQMRKDL